MLTPTVRELPRRMQPTTPDTFNAPAASAVVRVNRPSRRI